MSFSRLAAALRFANRAEHAEQALGIAFEAAPPYLKGEMHRRRAWLRIYQGRLPEGLQEAKTAVDLTVGQEHALALGTLGAALYYTGDFRSAVARLGECVAELNPDAEHRYSGMLGTYLMTLSQGTEEDARRALTLCPELRSQLKRRHKMQRAKVWWIEGLLHKRLGDPRAAWRALDIARRSLIVMKAAPEVGAIVADMAEVSPEPLAVRTICLEAADVITAGHPLKEPLGALTQAGRELIPETAGALRKAASLLVQCPAI